MPVQPSFWAKVAPATKPGIAVADGVCAGDELNLTPVHPGVAQCGPGGDDAVLGEVAAPFAPRVHTRAEDVDGFRRAHSAILHA